MAGVEVELRRSHTGLARKRVARVGTSQHRVILRVNGRVPPAGRYTVVARRDGRTLAERAVIVRPARRVRRPGRFDG